MKELACSSLFTSRHVAVVDFETEAIQPRPQYPPLPVGVAIQMPGERVPTYYAWGHPTENNASKQHALHALRKAWQYPVVFHNAPFDIDVAIEHFDLCWPETWHCTMILAFLHNPHELNLSLKPLTDKLFDDPPAARDRVKEWILANVPEARKKPTSWGAYIARAPGKLVGTYARDDVRRTKRLFALTYAYVRDSGQLAAYDRERRLAPVLIRMEQRGFCIAQRKLRAHLPLWRAHQTAVEVKIKRKLGIGKRDPRWEDFKFSGTHFVEAVLAAGLMDEETALRTDKGNISVGKKSLAVGCTDPGFVKALRVRNQIAFCIGTLAEPWLKQADANGGRAYAKINQVRSRDDFGGKGVGARTGRLSMTPNMQNPIRGDKDARVPAMRDYVVPSPSHTYLGRDYKQQEPRLLAHYEDGDLLAAYRNDPNLDAHDTVRKMIRRVTYVRLSRYASKTLGLATTYGFGIPSLADTLGVGTQEAYAFRQAYFQALPGVKGLIDDLCWRGRDGQHIRTLGGRVYYCEPPKVINGHKRYFEYKLLNHLIQGSAADVTKEALCLIDAEFEPEEFALLLCLHDENIGESPFAASTLKIMGRLDECMRAAGDALGCDVAMLSEGKLGSKSWGQMQEVDY